MDATLIDLTLPWPPSANAYWRHPSRGPLAGRHLISVDGRMYRKAVQAAWVEQGARRILGQQSLCVAMTAFPPDRRRRDLDNLCKASLDALVHAGIIEDDSLIDELHIIRGPRIEGGSLHVRITVREPNGNDENA